MDAIFAFFKDYWHVALYDKFRNERKHYNDPEVIIHKKRKLQSQKEKGITQKLRRGAINWLTPFPEGEDDNSLKKHREFMQNEWCRASPELKKNKQADGTNIS